MNYMLMPSLQHIALVKISAALWNGYGVRALITDFSFPFQEFDKIEEWGNIEANIAEKVLEVFKLPEEEKELPEEEEEKELPLEEEEKKLPEEEEQKLPKKEEEIKLPKLLCEKILGIIKPIGLEILKWMEYHCRGSFFRVNLPNELCWTPQGTIDTKRTAQMLVRDESLDVTMRYKLACIYFLDEDIWKLWNEIPEARKNSFFYEEYRGKEKHQWEIVCVWTKEMKQEWDRGMSLSFSYQSLIEYCAREGNKAAAEYFLPKLPPRERDISLVTTVGCVQDTHMLWYLLCEMNDEQKLDVLKEHHYNVLKYLLNWPLQGFFMETADCVLELLNDTQLCWLLYEIDEKINGNYKDCDYQELFGELWKKMSNNSKSGVVGKILSTSFRNCHILQWLFEIEDEEKIREIFQMATPIQKKQFVFCSDGMYIFRTLIRIGKMRLVRLFFDECLSSEDETMEFFEEFEAYITEFYPKGELDNLAHKLEEIFSGYI